MGLEMADSISVKIEGIDDLKRILSEIPRQLRNKHLVSALRKSAKVIRDEAKRLAPVLTTKTKYRNIGTVKNAIKTRVSKQSRRDGNVGVFVNVKPLSSDKISFFKVSRAAMGMRWGGWANPNDPYYWRWLEFGRKIVSRDKSLTGGGITVYKQRLVNGKIVTRKKEWSAGSITGRRRNANTNVAAKPFLRPAANLLPQSLEIFKREMAPIIQWWNNRK